ncbi:hypothetical protein B6U81_05215 [Thermoplasmatales archaeon ex4484_30]|nr:MAG: hypothetical protein B6U81_05215 [Thermoplasmatales archaeon ex4484_30]
MNPPFFDEASNAPKAVVLLISYIFPLVCAVIENVAFSINVTSPSQKGSNLMLLSAMHVI